MRTSTGCRKRHASVARRRYPHATALAGAPLAGLAALVLYARTLAPGLTWAHHAADGGDLLAAALVGGVPHPSGYPTYQLLLRTAVALFPGEPARAGNWLSALCAAAAAALCADLAGRMLARIDPRGAAPGWSGLATLAAALTWAASPILWGQAVVTEVYALNALTVVGLLWLLWRWREAVDAGTLGQRKWPEGWPWLAGAGAALGLGLVNHLTLLLMLPGAAIWLWAGRRAAGRPLGRELLVALAAVVVGLSIYAYLPLAAATNPPVNWGDPRRFAQIWALISGQVYRGLIFGLPLAYLPGRLAAWSGEAQRQLGGPWGIILALIGLWQLDRRLHAWWQATLLIAVAYSVYAIGYNTPDSFVYLIPASCVAALWLAAGLGWLVENAAVAARRFHHERANDASTHSRIRVLFVDGRPVIFRAYGHDARDATADENVGRVGNPSYAPILRVALVALLLAVPAISAARFWPENDLSHDREAQEFVTRALADAAPDAIILTSGDGPTFALWYAVYGLGLRPDVAPINVNLVAFDWYRRALAGRHPDLAAGLSVFDPAQPAGLAASLATLAAQRPLYRAEPLTVPLPGYAERPAGSLIRLIRDPNE